MKAGAIILSGGKSSRMGSNKALLKINDQPNIERIRDRLKSYFNEMILVTNEPKSYEFLGLKVTSDHYPGMGPLAGLHAGLLASESDMNLLAACDMPFVSGELAHALVTHAQNYDAVIPVIEGKQHPLFAVYHKRVAMAAESCIKSGNLRMKHLLDQLNVLYLTEKQLGSFSQLDIEKTFFNMNHPSEYEDAKRQAASES
ncbi:molybdenum cofactor guanylyltransferase [Neobacillus dielmonensis]|uniref:molybdenum cofactor guanylyltransferase n=1 Tax=Neobacillus dielmonensis TaxID=1347369 RepID=UPI0005AB14F2|nr:molybdenum cofactor guanylyltransferase [Neobacillus dielmonensis]